MEKTEKRLYILGIISSTLLLMAIMIGKKLNLDLLKLVPPCGFRFITGYYCPGCGGTRAVRALFSGKFITSFFYHPFVIYCAIIMAVFMITNTIQLLSRNRLKIGLKYRHGFIYAGVAVIIVNWIFQNIYIFLSK